MPVIRTFLIILCPMSDHSVQNFAQFSYFSTLKARVISNIVTVKMNVFGLRVIPVFLAKEFPEIGLAELITASRQTSPELHPRFPKRLFNPRGEMPSGF